MRGVSAIEAGPAVIFEASCTVSCFSAVVYSLTVLLYGSVRKPPCPVPYPSSHALPESLMAVYESGRFWSSVGPGQSSPQPHGQIPLDGHGSPIHLLSDSPDWALMVRNLFVKLYLRVPFSVSVEFAHFERAPHLSAEVSADSMCALIGRVQAPRRASA